MQGGVGWLLVCSNLPSSRCRSIPSACWPGLDRQLDKMLLRLAGRFATFLSNTMLRQNRRLSVTPTISGRLTCVNWHVCVCQQWEYGVSPAPTGAPRQTPNSSTPIAETVLPGGWRAASGWLEFRADPHPHFWLLFQALHVLPFAVDSDALASQKSIKTGPTARS